MSEQELLLKALNIKEPTDRAAFLDDACVDRPELRLRLVKLIEAHERAGANDRTGAFAPAAARTEVAGTIVAGKYKLLQQIGEGGMGSVWMADQLEPVKRRVAVKLIRSERDGSKTILSRFEAERQAIALMDHPNIAMLLDAGTTDGEPGGIIAARPFFVMELVKGVALTEYCDQHKLSIPERLSLFTQICGAVQHAHQKGIIHRDLKPSNILVESHDDKPVPKVIDFGLAKAMSGQPLTEHTLFTALGTVAGTPRYMAPEQAKLNAIDIDTRADIYALGVILYELLTGTTPIEREEMKKAAFDEILRVIREQEPPTPSKRLSSADSKPSVAALRGTEPAKLGRFVRGDLDWIVMKALAKERDRRYETANGFAKDIERFLNHEPVLAGPPSASYRLKKFVRRNRGPVIAAGLVVLTLLAGIIGTTVGLIEAKSQEAVAIDERDKKEDARKNEELQRQRADANAAKANATVAEYFTRVSENKLLKSKLPGLQPLRKELLEAALNYYKVFVTEHQDDPAMKVELARAYYRVGRILSDIGGVPETEAAQRSSLAAWNEILTQFPDDVGYRKEAAYTRLALAWILDRKQDVSPDWEEHIRIAEKTFADLVAANPNDTDARLGLAEACHAAASWYYKLGRHEIEGDYNRRTYAEWVKLAAADPKYSADLASEALNLGYYYARQGNSTEALRHHERAREVFAQLVKENPTDTIVRLNLSRAYTNIGYVYASLTNDQSRAAVAFEASVREVDPLVRDHPAVVHFRFRRSVGLSMLAKAFVDSGQSDRAMPYVRQSIADLEEALQLEPNDRAAVMELGLAYGTLGRLEAETGQLTVGIATLKKACDRLERLVAANTSATEDRGALARAHRLTGIYRRQAGDLGGSRESLERALAVLEDPVIADRPKSMSFLAQIVVATNELVRTLRKSADLPAAELACARLETLWTKELNRDPHGQQMARYLADAFANYGCVLRARGKLEAARNMLEEAIRIAKDLGPLDADELIDLACAEAQLSVLPETAKAVLPAKHADRAMELLRKAVMTGSKEAFELLGASDLDPLRGREDFKRLIVELEAKRQQAPPPREVKP